MARSGFRSRIIFSVTTLFLCVLSFAAWFTGERYKSHFRESVSADQYLLISFIADDIDENLRTATAFLARGAVTLAPAGVTQPAAASASLAALAAVESPFSDGLFLFDAAGALLAEHPGIPGGTSATRNYGEFVRRTLATKRPQVSPAFASPHARRHPAIFLTAPVIRGGRVVGVLAGSIDLTRDGLLAKIASTRIGTGGYLFLFDTNGTMLLHPDPERVMRPAAPPGKNRLLEAAVQGFQGSGETVNAGGISCVSSYRRLQATNWIIGASLPVAEAYAPIYRTEKQLLLYLLPIFILTVFMVRKVTDLLLAPLAAFINHVRDLRDKEGDERFIRLQTGDEVEALAQSVNTMVAELDLQRRELSETSQLYKTIADFSTEMVYLADPGGTFRYLSPSCERLTGFRVADYERNPGLFGTILDAGSRASWDQLWQDAPPAVVEGEELLLVDVDGNRRWIAHSRRAICDESGTCTGYRGSFVDITRRKIAEERLTDQLHFLQVLLDAIPTPVFYKNADGRYVGCNRAFEEYLGMSREALIGKTVFDVAPAELAAVYLKADEELFANGGIQVYESRLRYADGSMRDVIFYKAVFTREGGARGLIGTILDISDRKKAEAALRTSEERFRLFVEESRDAIFVTDADLCLIHANQALLDLFGVTTQEVTGTRISDSFCDGDCRVFLLDEIRQKGSVRDAEVTLRTRSGDKIVCLVTASIRRGTGGNFLGIQGIFHDITLRKQAEEELREQNAYLAALHETTLGLMKRLEVENLLLDIITRAGGLMDTEHGYIYLLDPAGGELVKRISTGAFENFFDYRIRPGDGLVGQVWQEGTALVVDDYCAWSGRLPDSGRDCLKAAVGVPLKSGNQVVGVIGLAYLAEGGKFGAREVGLLERFAELASISLDNARLYGAARQELAERMRAEAELVKLSHAVEQSPVTVVITDTAGTIEYVNPKFSEVTGYAAEEVLGKNPRILRGDGSPATDYRQLWSTISAGREWRGEFTNRRKNGQQYTEFAQISPIRDASGAITHYIAIKEDVTDRKKLEGQLRHSQKMDAVGQLAGGIAHDFNNILTAIIGYASFLQMDPVEDARLAKGLKQIIASAERGAGLTRALLSFSRNQESDPRPVNVNDIVTRIESLLRRLIGEDIDLRTAVTAQPLTIMADPLQIEQVLMNLATNARDAMPEGGTIEVSTAVQYLDSLFVRTHGYGDPGPHVVITFTDTGTGMDEETLKKIFEPFFTTKEVGKGTGLGLAIVYGIVKKHNGYILCYSETGRGSTFRILFPLLEETGPEPEVEVENKVVGGDETILVAEDDEVARGLAADLLTEYGYRVITAADGEEAVALFGRHAGEVGLVILDVVMPKMNGREAYEAIVRMEPDVKALFMSGYTADIVHRKGLLRQGVTCLSKPLFPKRLLRTVREVLDA